MFRNLSLSFHWQRNAKAYAEQTYRSKLKKAGLKEQFVEENGDGLISEDDRSTEDDIRSRYAVWEIVASFVHPVSNTTVSGKNMNSTAAGRAKDFMWFGHVALHNFLSLLYSL